MLSTGDILYHGSYAAIERIDLSRCVAGRDFGKGFYLTSDHDQAQRFIASSLRKAHAIGRVNESQDYGYVSSFRVAATSNLGVFEFSGADASWLRYVAVNRRSSLAGVLGHGLASDLTEADVVRSEIACLTPVEVERYDL